MNAAKSFYIELGLSGHWSASTNYRTDMCRLRIAKLPIQGAILEILLNIFI